MNQEQRDKILEVLKEINTAKEKLLKFQLDSRLQLFVSQLDLFKVISTLVVAFIGIGYLYDTKSDQLFSLISFSLSLVTLVLSISYTREVIDLSASDDASDATFSKIEDHEKVLYRALRDDDYSIFENLASTQLSIANKKEQPNYIGEVLVFLFYLSVGFLGLSFLARQYSFGLISCQTLVVLVLTYLLSFKSWAHALSGVLSKPIG